MNTLSKIIMAVVLIITGSMLAFNCSKEKTSEPPPTASSKWTILVYAAGNYSMDTIATGHSFCIGDIQALERVGSTNDVQVIAMLSAGPTLGIAHYYHIEHFQDNGNTISSPVLQNLGERNMADGTTLKDFLLYGIRNYPAENYMLLIDSQGSGWPGCCHDDLNGGAPMHTADMANAIEQAISESGIAKFEVMALYSPLMGMTEVAYELRNCSHWLVASGISTSMRDLLAPEGWLTPLNSNPSAFSSILATNFAQSIYDEGQNRSENVQMAMIDLNKIVRLANIAGQLGQDLSQYSGPYWNEILDARHQANDSNADDPAYVDLLKFVATMYNSADLRQLEYIRNANDSLSQAFHDAVPINLYTPGLSPRNGLTIHLPARQELYDSTNYARLDFHNLGWNHFVSNFIGVSEGLGLPTTISGTISWQNGRQLSDHAYAFLDTISSPFRYHFDSTLAVPMNGYFNFTFSLLDSFTVVCEGWDDADSNAIPDAGDGFGGWDRDGNGNWSTLEDTITILPGQNISGINIQLMPQYKAR